MYVRLKGSSHDIANHENHTNKHNHGTVVVIAMPITDGSINSDHGNVPVQRPHVLLALGIGLSVWVQGFQV